MAQVRTMIRWPGGFVAVGGVIATGDSSRTPVFTSADGGTWTQLDAGVFGPTTMVVGLVPTASGVVALTLEGGPNLCDGDTSLSCWKLSPPFHAWTSSDGATWTEHPGPDVAIVSDCDECGIEMPIIRSGSPGIIVITTSRYGREVAVSQDGSAWETLTHDPFDAALGSKATMDVGDVTALGSGFVAGGQTRGDPGQGVILWSADGRAWERQRLPLSGIDPQGGSTVRKLFAGPQGVVAVGGDLQAPGTEFWWSSGDGRTWRRLSGYPPLGVWTGEGEGSGMIPNGNLVADGERLVAYRGGAKTAAWTSFDGRAWTKLAVTGSRPVQAGDWPIQSLLLLPVGLLWVGDDRSTWLGVPRT